MKKKHPPINDVPSRPVLREKREKDKVRQFILEELEEEEKDDVRPRL